VAVLVVDTQSVAGNQPLPTPLNVRLQVEAASTAAPVFVGLVGYPDLSNATEPVYLELKAKGVRGGKVYSPGAVLSVEIVSGFDILLHVANTMDGNSGSPLFQLGGDFDVIGIHNCCRKGIAVAPPPGTPPCGQFTQTRPHRNIALSAWSVAANPTLNPFFVAKP
jgi:hypothetical protein